MHKKEIMLTTRAVLDARDSNLYKNHREYIMAAFKTYHSIDIDPNKFDELIFDYKKNGNIIVSAHSGAYRAARN